MRKSLGKRVSRGREVLHLRDIFLCSSWDMPMFWSSLGRAVGGGTTENGHGWGCRWGGHGLWVKADWAQRQRSVGIKVLHVIKLAMEFLKVFPYGLIFFSSCKLFPTFTDVWICVMRACLEVHWNQRATFAFLAARTGSDLWGLLPPTHAKPLERDFLTVFLSLFIVLGQCHRWTWVIFVLSPSPPACTDTPLPPYSFCICFKSHIWPHGDHKRKTPKMSVCAVLLRLLLALCMRNLTDASRV